MHADDNTSATQIRELHHAWFAAARAKDLDASMSPIAPGVVSYEHSTPLQYTKVEDIREECRRGFEYQPDDFEWTVPDLTVVVRDDLAVAWGLNRMASRTSDTREDAEDAEDVEDVVWSRGTRVFQRIGGDWKMIHQHVSFPVDPETGAAATTLTP